VERKEEEAESERAWPERGPRFTRPQELPGDGLGGDSKREDDRWRELSVDPLSRALAAPVAHPPPEAAVPTLSTLERVEPTIEAMLGRVVKRIAWGGDGRRGTARLELGSGELAGAVILLEADERGVEIDVELPAGCSADVWRDRILERLRDRGLSVQRFDVR
jgi:hypothetical protein